MGARAGDSFRHCTNVTMKMYGFAPGRPGPNILSHVGCLPDVMPTEVLGAMHPAGGCVLLSVDLWYNCNKDMCGAEAGMDRNFLSVTNHTGRDMFWAQHNTDVLFSQSEHQVRGGEVVRSAPRRAHATIEAVSPAVCNPGAHCVNVVLSNCAEGAECRLVCRVKGEYFRMDVMQERRLPDGRMSFKLRAPVNDGALGLAWLEVLQTLPTGQLLVSQPYPMFLTTYCDICEEMSIMFSGLSPPEARSLAGVLKDLEDLYHPFDPSQELEPEAFAPLVLWCASNSFHETLVAVTDEIVFCGVSCPLRTLLDATNRLAGPSGLLTSAAMSRSQQTFDAVSLLMIEADQELEGDLPGEGSIASTSLSGGNSGGSARGSVGTMNSRVSGIHTPMQSVESLSLDERWGARTMKYLTRPLSAPTTLTGASLLFSWLPWGHSQVAGHALFVTACIHLFLPLMYSFAYERYVDDLQRKAANLGLNLSTRTLSFGDPETVKLYNAYAMQYTDNLLRRIVFLIHILISTLTFPILKYSKHGFLGEDWTLSAMGAVAHAVLCVLRFRASRRGSLLDAQRVNGVVSHMINISLLCFVIQAGLYGTVNFALPIYFIEGNNGWSCPWARMLTSYAANVAFFTGIRVTVLPNAWQDVFLQKLLQSIIYFLCGFLAHAIETARGGIDAPFLWVAWTLADLPIAITTIGLRTRFEAVMLRGFMEELEGKHSKE